MRRAFGRAICLVVVLGLLIPSACHVTDVTLWRPLDNAGPAPCPVMEFRDIVYRGGLNKDEFRHHLDLYVPADRRDFPVVFLVHGGAWLIGDNRCCGLYSSVGQFLASQGIGAVLPNYRLSPGVKHPAHVQDVASAVAWTKSHIAEYGGRADRLFLLGHSAGGHLVSLLATDDRYLRAEGLTLADIRGVIAVSGVYHVLPGPVHGSLGGNGPMALHMDQLVPVRATSSVSRRRSWPALSLDLNLYGWAFDDDPQVRADASPVNHVHRGLSPFLLINADNDLPTLVGMADEFGHALANASCDVSVLRVAGRNHSSVMFHAVSVDDPVAHAILAFVHRHTD